MEDLENLFRILEIKDKNPSWNQIKYQFRKKVFESHPDIGGNEKDFIKVYDAYQLIIKKYNPEKIFINEEEFDVEKPKIKLSKEIIKEIQEKIFSKYVAPEIEYFLKKATEQKENLIYLKKYFEREKEGLFLENIFESPNLITESDVDLLKGELFQIISYRITESNFPQKLISENPFDRELFEKYVLLTKPGKDLVELVPLEGKNIKGLELIISLNAPQKYRTNKPKDNYFPVKVFGTNWIAENIIVSLHVGNYREHFKGYRELYSTPLLDLDKEEYTGFDIKIISSFLEKMKNELGSKNFELELSREFPKGHPLYKNYKKQKGTFLEESHSDKYGFYINNLKLGDLDVVIEGAPQDIKKYFNAELQLNKKHLNLY